MKDSRDVIYIAFAETVLAFTGPPGPNCGAPSWKRPDFCPRPGNGESTRLHMTPPIRFAA